MTRYWRYKLDGKVIPAVSTILKYKDPEPLMRWAAKLALEEGVHYAQQRDQKANTGSMVHAMIEARLWGKETTLSAAEYKIETPEEWDLALQEANRGFDAFFEWKEMVGFEPVATEIKLVSREFRFGGTPDAIGRIGGKLCLLDWKTSGAIYASHFAQIAAYRHLWQQGECYYLPDEEVKFPPAEFQQPIEACYVLRADKTWSAFSFKQIPDEILDRGWNMFLHSLGIHENIGVLEKFARG